MAARERDCAFAEKLPWQAHKHFSQASSDLREHVLLPGSEKPRVCVEFEYGLILRVSWLSDFILVLKIAGVVRVILLATLQGKKI